LTEPPAQESSRLVDLTGMTLARIRQLCDPSADPDGFADLAIRPALRRALLRVQLEAARGDETFAGFDNNPPP